MKLLTLATHPIQYQAPWFRALAARPELDFAVAFAHLPTAEQQGVGFGVPFEWDAPLRDGYRSFTLELAGRDPDLGRFRGLRTRRLVARLRREAPDALLVTGWNSWVLVQGILAAGRLGLPLILRGEANDLRPRPPLVRAIQRRIVARAAAHLAIGTANRRFLEARGVDPGRIVDAPYFVDNAAFGAAADRERERRGERRHGWGLEENAFVLLFAGKLVARKRPADLLAAFEAFPALRERARLLVVGDGELRAGLEARARAGGLPVRFAGFLNQSEIPRAYAAADLLVLPSDAGETWGLVVNEAMASGLPAVVSDRVGCAPDLIVPGETGETFPCGDVAALASTLERWTDDPERTRAAGRAARELVTARFTVERTVEATLEALRFVTGEGRS